MDLKNLVKTVSQVAPLLGSILPIPGAKEIVKIIAHEFGGDENNPSELASRILSDPQAHAKLVEIESNTRVQLQQLLVQNAQNELAATQAQFLAEQQDRADARKNGQTSWMPAIVTLLIFAGFFASFAAMLVLSHINLDEQVLFMMLGTISTAFGGSVTYWLGSSNGSRGKDIAIQKALAKLSG